MSRLNCPLCFEFSGTSISEFLRHVRLFHADARPFSLRCNLGCNRERPFTSFLTFRDHVYRLHSGITTSVCTHELPQDDINQSHLLSDVNLDTSDDESPTEEHVPVDYAAKLQRSAATFILQVQEKHNIPQSTMEKVIKEVDSFYQTILTCLYGAVCDLLSEVNMDDKVSGGLESMFAGDGPYGRLFSGLETNHLQMKYYKEHFQLVEPERVVLGKTRKYKGIGVKRRCVEKDETMHYVPVLKTLDVILQNETVLAEVHNGHSDREGYLKDYCDGSEFKRHPLFSIHANSLQLIFYYDDVEICNPLGSKSSIHKLGFFYFSLGNISPEYRSKLSSIYLVAIAKQKYISAYGMEAILAPFLKDIAKLESGFTFPTSGRKFYGTIAVISADNLAANLLGGFKEGSTAYRGCRQCMATPEDLKTRFNEEAFQLRTSEEYLEQCEDLEAGPYDHFSKEYGINSKSTLTQLKYFDLCSGAIVTDVMHDVLEGVLQYEVKLLLCHCIRDEKYFRLSLLNDCIENYELGFMEASNRPTPIKRKTLYSSDHSLKQNASQMWLLGRILPAMVGQFIPREDENWCNVLLLLRITTYLFTPKITSDEADYLAILIEQHHETFRDLYPEESITPKFHYMVHMPRLIKKFGPLVRLWTMRFEARHSYFKRLAAQMGNFINISYSLSVRHQRLQCYHQLDQHSVGGEDMEVGPGEMVDRDIGHPITSRRLYRAKWVKVNGTMYKDPCAVLLGVTESILPKFGSMQEILIDGEEVLFVVKVYRTLSYSEHFNAYIIKLLDEVLTISQRELYSFMPLHARRIEGLTTASSQRAVILKHHVSTL